MWSVERSLILGMLLPLISTDYQKADGTAKSEIHIQSRLLCCLKNITDIYRLHKLGIRQFHSS